MIPEATPVTLVTVVYRDGTPRLWPVKHPRAGEKDNRSWISARAAARVGMERWVKLVWVGNAYQTRDAMPGYSRIRTSRSCLRLKNSYSWASARRGSSRARRIQSTANCSERRPRSRKVAAMISDHQHKLLASVSHWRELPHREIWVYDTEFYPGRGLNNGGRDGDLPTPVCVVACEMRTACLLCLWQDEFGRDPPFSLGPDVLVIAYFNTAEFGTHLALGWGQPACSLDAYAGIRLTTNGTAGSRSATAIRILTASAARCSISTKTPSIPRPKRDMRNRILQGPPFSDEERIAILDYCQSDVDALARLVPHLIPLIRSLPHAMLRTQFVWSTACQERRGIPISPILDRLKEHWSEISARTCSRTRQGIRLLRIRPRWPAALAQATVHRLPQPHR